MHLAHRKHPISVAFESCCYFLGKSVRFYLLLFCYDYFGVYFSYPDNSNELSINRCNDIPVIMTV